MNEFIKLMSGDLPVLMVVLPLAIVANNLLGAAKAKTNNEDTFSKSKLRKGLLKGTFVYAAILTYALISYIMVDLEISILGGDYNLVDAMHIILMAALVRYSKDGITKLANIMGYKREEVVDESDIEDEYIEEPEAPITTFPKYTYRNDI